MEQIIQTGRNPPVARQVVRLSDSRGIRLLSQNIAIEVIYPAVSAVAGSDSRPCGKLIRGVYRQICKAAWLCLRGLRTERRMNYVGDDHMADEFDYVGFRMACGGSL